MENPDPHKNTYGSGTKQLQIRSDHELCMKSENKTISFLFCVIDLPGLAEPLTSVWRPKFEVWQVDIY